jgi:hypothetical protein
MAGRPPLEEIMASRKAAVSWPSSHELVSSANHAGCVNAHISGFSLLTSLFLRRANVKMTKYARCEPENVGLPCCIADL